MADSIVLEFLDKARYCKNVEELSSIVQGIFERMGFPLWAYQTQSEIILEKSQPVIVHNYPKKWVKYYVENNFTDVDPVMTYGSKLVTPFQWSHLTKGIELSKDTLEFNSLASDFGMRDGLAIPLLGANGRISMLSLVADVKNTALSAMLNQNRDQIMALSFAFHSIAKDFIKDGHLIINKIKLTSRESECLLWTAKGKSSWEVGMILNISERTVVFHINNAKNKFNVTSKYHLIVKAILEGYIKI
tara:strand:- start:148058 stop:148795 length:738 start_codon:yes stop_codon:yes gene_type:complete